MAQLRDDGRAAVGHVVVRRDQVLTCDFPGCKAAFGVPLVLGATLALLLVGGD